MVALIADLVVLLACTAIVAVNSFAVIGSWRQSPEPGPVYIINGPVIVTNQVIVSVRLDAQVIKSRQERLP